MSKALDRLEKKIQRIDRVLNQLEARRIDPLKALERTVKNYDRRTARKLAESKAGAATDPR